MHVWKTIAATVLIVIVLILFVSVYNDMTRPTQGVCEDQTGSICTQSSVCPNDFRATNRYTCFDVTWHCCIPA